MNNESKYYIITKSKQLKSYIETIKNEKIIFIDTEFHRDKTYYASLCLIQIATQETLVAIDPLPNNLDLTPLIEFLDNEKVTKVFHAAKQDLEILFKLNNNKPIKNIFDTQIAALALGLGDQIGYANLVKNMLKIDLDKSQQIANWQKRPMSAEQLDYAMADVIYLKEIYYLLIKKINKKNRLPLIEKELEDLTDPNNLTTNEDEVYKAIKLRDKTPLTITILQQLAKLREQESKKHNKYRNAILRDEFLSYCARLKPRTIDDLELVRGVNQSILNKYGKIIVNIINKCFELPKDQLTQPEAENDDNTPIVDSQIKTLAMFLLQLKAKEHEMSMRLIANSKELTYFLASDKYPSNLRKGWRWELFGQDLEKLRTGQLFIGIKGNSIDVKEITQETEVETGVDTNTESTSNNENVTSTD